MRTLVVGDIHGCYDAFMDILHKAKYSDSDRLIIVGDLADAGENGIKVMQEVEKMQKSNANVIVTLGNHDLLFLSALRDHNTLAYGCWMNNYNYHTEEVFRSLKTAEQKGLIAWLGKQRYVYETDYYVFTHSTLPTWNNKEELSAAWGRRAENTMQMHSKFDPLWAFAIWHRYDKPMLSIIPQTVPNKVLISGHTIVTRYHSCYNIFFDLKNHYIDIDCGAKQLALLGNQGKLACLELPEYYVTRENKTTYKRYYSARCDK